MTVVPIMKRMVIIMTIQVYLISRKNFDYKENGRKKAFLANPRQQYRASHCGEHNCHANNKKKIETVMSIQVCLISWMNIDYMKNG